MMILLLKNNLDAKSQVPIKIEFENQIIGDYIADILVEDEIIIELKAISKINDKHKVQAINYLKATNKKLALIINFGSERLEYERVINK